jgi:ureidoglycolate lyase
MTVRLCLQPAVASLLDPFGTLHERPGVGMRQRLDTAMANGREAAALRMSLTTKAPSPLPCLIGEMERHPFSTQTFIPVDAGPWLAVVAPSTPDGLAPDLDRLTGLLLRGDQGLTYALGVWHAPLTALERPACFITTIWRDGSERDQDIAVLADPLEIIT